MRDSRITTSLQPRSGPIKGPISIADQAKRFPISNICLVSTDRVLRPWGENHQTKGLIRSLSPFLSVLLSFFHPRRSRSLFFFDIRLGLFIVCFN